MKHCPQCQQTFNDLENVCPNDGTILYLQDLLHLVGCTIAKKYTIEQMAGVGGMSVVYRAHQRETDRPVALKILLPHLTLNDPEMVRMFEREARAAGQINHPNVATIYDSGRTADDLVYLAMEWLEGHTLEKIIKQNAPLDWETAAQLLEQITAGLTAAHQCRIIHRDLKPGNIMVMPQANGSLQVKILDFGIAKIARTESDNYVSTAVGTVHYASPEQMIPGNAIDARTDLYALGVMLFEMLAGRLPFEGPAVSDLIRQHLLETPLPLSFNRPDAPIAIVELIERMLKKKPAERPANALEVWHRFEQALRPQSPQPAVNATFTAFAPTVREIPAEYADSLGVLDRLSEPNHQPDEVSPNDIYSLVPARSVPTENRYHGSAYESAPYESQASVTADPIWQVFSTESAPPPAAEPGNQIWETFANDPTPNAHFKAAPEPQGWETPVWETKAAEPLPFPSRNESFSNATWDGFADDSAYENQPGVATGFAPPSHTGGLDVRDLFAAAPNTANTQNTLDVRAIPLVTAKNQSPRSRKFAIGALALLLGLVFVVGWKRRAAARAKAKAAPTANASAATGENPITTSAPAALQSFKQAISLTGQEGKAVEAIKLLQQALAADEQFALAHLTLAQRAVEQGDWETVYTHADRAEALKDQVSERERQYITAAHLALRHGDLEEAQKSWRALLSAFPQAHDAHAQLIQTQLQLGQFEDAAKEAAQLRAADASLGSGHAFGFEAALALGRAVEARTLALSAEQRRLPILSVHHRQFQMAVVQNQPAGQNEQLKWLPMLSAAHHSAFWQAERSIFAGRLNEAATLTTQGTESLPAHTSDIPVVRWLAAQAKLQLSLAYTLAGHRSQAKTLYEQAAQLAPTARLQAGATFGPLLLALNGDAATAQKLMEEIAAQHPRHTLYQSLWLPLTRAALALSARQPDQALEQLQAAERYAAASHLWSYWLGAQAHLQKKQPAEATQLLQKLQTNAGLDQLSVMRPLAMLGLAQAAQQQGDKEQSRRQYETFLTFWEKADADLPVIKSARAALR